MLRDVQFSRQKQQLIVSLNVKNLLPRFAALPNSWIDPLKLLRFWEAEVWPEALADR